MPRYYFNLVTTRSVIVDPDGTELPDEVAARGHARAVADELMRHRDRTIRAWRLDVRDEKRQPLFGVLFASVDHGLNHLDADLRCRVETLCASVSKLADTMRKVQFTVLSIEAAKRRAREKPYLATYDGIPVETGAADAPSRPEDTG
jgi:hypothetical protein